MDLVFSFPFFNLISQLWYVKLPFSVDSKPFDEMNYSEPTENPNAITDAVMRWRRKEKDNQLIVIII